MSISHMAIFVYMATQHKLVGWLVDSLWHINFCGLLYAMVNLVCFGLVLWHINHCRLLWPNPFVYI